MPHEADLPEEPMAETMGRRDVKKTTRPKARLREDEPAEAEIGFSRPPVRSRTGDVQ